MIGKELASYRILEKLGEGGMGEVYLAEDTRLKRRVALKILLRGEPADERSHERFAREAESLAALNHPNIVTIHDFGVATPRAPTAERGAGEAVHYLVMEWVEGGTLAREIPRGGFEISRFLDIAIPLADAVAAAHSKGIIHRDLKTGNVMVDTAGRVKVMDFGLAKLAPAVLPASGETTAAALTRTGHVVGTIGYMAPEQLLGRAADERTDVFSLGMVLYEMALGAPPFAGETAPARLSAILKDPPRRPCDLRAELPRQLERILLHCLEKEPDRRFQSALDVRNELDSLRREIEEDARRDPLGEPSEPVPGRPAATPTPPRRPTLSGWRPLALAVALATLPLGFWWARGRRGSEVSRPVAQPTVAVLPFQFEGSEPATDYLRIAVPDEIATVLSRAPSLAVRPFSLSMRFVGAEVDILEAARELAAVNLVTGQILPEGGELRLTLEAIDTEANRVLWRESLSATAEDLLSLRERVAETIRRGLVPLLGDRAESAGTTPSDPRAYELYLRSLALSADRGPNEEALALLERALSLDDGYAPIWVQVARRAHHFGNYGGGGEAALARAVAAARRARELDPSLLDAAMTLVSIRVEAGDLVAGNRVAHELLASRPDRAESHFARAYVFRYAGLVDEAKTHCERAIALDPTNPRLRSCSIPFLVTGDFDRARDFLALDPGSEFTIDALAHLALAEGRPEEALAQFRRLPEGHEYRRIEGGFVEAYVEGRPVRGEETRRLLATYGVSDSEFLYFAATILAVCGEEQGALSTLRRAIAANYCAFPTMDRDPALRSLRGSAEFASLRREAQACRERFVRQMEADEGGSDPIASPANRRSG